MTKKTDYKFKAEDFWQLMENQQGCCALSGRKLTPDSVEVELREPFKSKGRADLENHYLIDRMIASVARYHSEDEIIQLAIEIVKRRGKEYGYTIRKKR